MDRPVFGGRKPGGRAWLPTTQVLLAALKAADAHKNEISLLDLAPLDMRDLSMRFDTLTAQVGGWTDAELQILPAAVFGRV